MGKEVSAMYLGKAVEFSRWIEESEEYADRGMRARVTSVQFQADANAPCNSYYVFTFDFLEFEARNEPLETNSWYDDDDTPTLTFRQCIGADKINSGNYYLPIAPYINWEYRYFSFIEEHKRPLAFTQIDFVKSSCR